jgi:hypothetical protein
MHDLRTIEKIGARVRVVEESVPADDLLLGLARAMAASLIGFLVSSIFISTLYYPSVWVMIGLSVALKKWANSVNGKESSLEVSMRSRGQKGLGPSRGQSKVSLQ